jgi:hypothetical protein
VFRAGYCPGCDGSILIHLIPVDEPIVEGSTKYRRKEEVVGIVYPTRRPEKPIAPEVPQTFAGDYKEACRVLDASTKASAALNRRLLQRIFHEHYKIQEKDLSGEIKKFINTQSPPSYLADALDAVRHVGNFAAHPMKDTNTGEIFDVEPGEAEWLVELLETMFDFCFVQPDRQKRRVADLNAKLTAAGKRPMS